MSVKGRPVWRGQKLLFNNFVHILLLISVLFILYFYTCCTKNVHLLVQVAVWSGDVFQLTWSGFSISFASGHIAAPSTSLRRVAPTSVS